MLLNITRAPPPINPDLQTPILHHQARGAHNRAQEDEAAYSRSLLLWQAAPRIDFNLCMLGLAPRVLPKVVLWAWKFVGAPPPLRDLEATLTGIRDAGNLRSPLSQMVLWRLEDSGMLQEQGLTPAAAAGPPPPAAASTAASAKTNAFWRPWSDR